MKRLWNLRDWADKPFDGYEVVGETDYFYVVNFSRDNTRRIAKKEDVFIGTEIEAYRALAVRHQAAADKLREQAQSAISRMNRCLAKAIELEQEGIEK